MLACVTFVCVRVCVCVCGRAGGVRAPWVMFASRPFPSTQLIKFG